MSTRKRLPRDERRAQLIEIGRRQVEASSFGELSTDAVADEAGISRGLLFHYFPTRQDFLVALAADAADELLELTTADASLPHLDRLRAGLDAYLDYVTERAELYLALVRGAAGGTAELQGVFDATRRELAARILEGLGLDDEDDRLRFAARGYVALTEEVVVTWLRAGDGQVARDELIDQLVRTAMAVLSAAAVPAGVPSD